MIAQIERLISESLRRTPKARVAAKRAYQTMCWLLLGKGQTTPGLVRVTPPDGEHIGGYYDQSPWDATGRFLLTMKVPSARRHPGPADTAEIRLLDSACGYAMRPLSTTRAWNVQQGCMLQWLGPDFSRRVIFNDFRDGAFCAVILDVSTGASRIVPRPVCAVSKDGTFALSLDFCRLHRMRPGYGYGNLPDGTHGELCPDSPCIWRVDLTHGTVMPLLRYADLVSLEPRPDMDGAEHKVNHIMINPDGTRFMVLHRWRRASARCTRLVTANSDGTGLYVLLDNDMVSHCCWRDCTRILTWARRHERGDRYLLLTDQTNRMTVLWDDVLMSDGHPTYSPDGRYVVTDTYPNRKRMARIFVADTASGDIREAACVYAPLVYDNETRCDLHPRWSRDGALICFDAATEGSRQMYIVTNPFLAHNDELTGSCGLVASVRSDTQ